MLKALEQIRRMRGDAQSHLMRCSEGNYYVVKFQNNPQHRRKPRVEELILSAKSSNQQPFASWR